MADIPLELDDHHTDVRGHRLRRMTGRNPRSAHRAATPLELLFDLAFVLAFGQAGNELAHAVAVDHWQTGVLGFVFAVGATCWAWINFSWFASAYDTDDWLYRITTMVQMIGVVVFALGLPVMFASLEHGDHIDNSGVVAGYVVMRVALIAQWLRAARQDPSRRQTALSYALFVGIAQIGWIVLLVLHTTAELFFVLSLVLWAIELAGPVLAERRSTGTPWHPHHIAERYGLLAIITLGEGVLGTAAAVGPVITEHGWTADAIILVVTGIGLTFALWWSYFTLPSGEILARFRNRAWVWGYGHVLIFGSIAATGAGLHVAAYVAEGHAEVGVATAVLAVAIPVVVYVATLFALYVWLTRDLDVAKVVILAMTSGIIVVAVVLAQSGASLSVCLAVVTLAPIFTVVWYEVYGHRRAAIAIRHALAEAPTSR